MRADPGGRRRRRLRVRGADELLRPASRAQATRRDRARLGLRPRRRGDHPRGRLPPPPHLLRILRGTARPLPRRPTRDDHLGEQLRSGRGHRRRELLLLALSADLGLGDLGASVAALLARSRRLAEPRRARLARTSCSTTRKRCSTGRTSSVSAASWRTPGTRAGSSARGSREASPPSRAGTS